MPDIEIVDLFAGPGGLDVAAKHLGLTATGIEWDDGAKATRKAAELGTEPGDVRNFGPEKFDDANVLAGGPPCQTYTVAGTGSGRRALEDVLGFAERMAKGEDVRSDLTRLDDVRTGLVLEPLRWALAAIEQGRAYDAIILEQVPAVLPVWVAMGKILESVGYSVDHGVLRAEQFGVPQTRRRAILIARRREVGAAKMPKPTHRPFRKGVPREAGDPSLKPWVPMREVVKRPQAYEVVSNYGTGGDPKARGRRTCFEPSATVTGKISRNRVVALDGRELDRFSHGEAGQLQTFPEGHPWRGRDVAQQIGNAIPPVLAAHVLAAALDLEHEVLAKAVDELSGGRITV
ncbi:DNA cytosine methyltransferase [Streptomyces sp. NPDC058572]|uniref:DNA cytosine methyltransferase n=1 Tax=Streptomyces sp. NPDC058572 TaxID=3346546 RepID=UPI0036465019